MTYVDDNDVNGASVYGQRIRVLGESEYYFSGNVLPPYPSTPRKLGITRSIIFASRSLKAYPGLLLDQFALRYALHLRRGRPERHFGLLSVVRTYPFGGSCEDHRSSSELIASGPAPKQFEPACSRLGRRDQAHWSIPTT